MRSTPFLILSTAAIGLVNAAPSVGDVIAGVLPAPSRYDSGRTGSDRTTGAVLETLRILPDDDNDGLLDVAGSLKVLEDGELLNLGGVIRVGNVVEACVDIVIDGVLTKRCGDGKRRGRKHRYTGIAKDDWTREEHSRCSKHFKSWHKQHGSRSCSDRLREAERKIRELERRLQECRPDSDYTPYRPVSDIKTVNHKPEPQWQESTNDWKPEVKPTWSGDSSNSDWSPDNNWKPEQEKDDDQWRDETMGKDCREGVYTYTDKDGIHVKACIAAKVDLGPVHADAKVVADANVDLNKGKVTAKAEADAKVGVDGVAEVTTKNDVKADVDLKKGQADVKVSTDDTLKVGDTKVVDTGLDAEVKINKPCPEGSLLNAANICVKLAKDDKHENDNGGSVLGLGNILGAGRVL